jgi:hypothetical protein
LRPGLNKGKWSKEEDDMLIQAVKLNLPSWGKVAEHVPGRTSKQCRERWCHHVCSPHLSFLSTSNACDVRQLAPTVDKNEFRPEEDHKLLALFAQYGNKWSRIAIQLPGRYRQFVDDFVDTNVDLPLS